MKTLNRRNGDFWTSYIIHIKQYEGIFNKRNNISHPDLKVLTGQTMKLCKHVDRQMTLYHLDISFHKIYSMIEAKN